MLSDAVKRQRSALKRYTGLALMIMVSVANSTANTLSRGSSRYSQNEMMTVPIGSSESIMPIENLLSLS